MLLKSNSALFARAHPIYSFIFSAFYFCYNKWSIQGPYNYADRICLMFEIRPRTIRLRFNKRCIYFDIKVVLFLRCNIKDVILIYDFIYCECMVLSILAYYLVCTLTAYTLQLCYAQVYRCFLYSLYKLLFKVQNQNFLLFVSIKFQLLLPLFLKVIHQITNKSIKDNSSLYIIYYFQTVFAIK